MESDDKLKNKAKKIIELLESKDKSFCLAIIGEWGIGKTYFWKTYIQNKLSQVVYITLFGKEHYSQILEEIVMQVCKRHNKAAKSITNIVSAMTKLATNGFVNINADALFSVIKKDDFEKMVICFDDIERKSDKLSMRDFMGLVAHLRDIKECKVVIILNDNKINNANEKQDDCLDFQIYKEKCVDYEFKIIDSNQMASLILKNEFENIENLKDREKLIELGLKCCAVDFEYNLRYLLKAIKNVRYFYEKCNFKQFYKEKNDDLFYQVFNVFFETIWLGEYKLTKDIDESPYSFIQSCVRYYFANDYSLCENNIAEICEYFNEMLQDEHFSNLHKVVRDYVQTNMSDKQYAQLLEKNIPNIKKFIFGKNNIYYDFSYYETIFRDYKKIKGYSLNDEMRIRKAYIDFYIAEQDKIISNKLSSTYELPNIKQIINNDTTLQAYYDSKKERNKTTLSQWLNDKWWQNIQSSFANNYIEQYNNFDIDEITNEFKTNEKFYQGFFEFFIITSNALIDKNNNLFKAFLNFLDDKDCMLKKEKVMAYLKNHPNANLNKLFDSFSKKH